MPRTLHYDRTLCLTVVGLTFFGLLMVFSVTTADADPSLRYIIKQSIAAAIGFYLMRRLMFTDYHEWRNQRTVFIAVGAAIILLILAFAFGTGANTSRFLRLGQISFQPSEAAKLALVLFLAYHLEQYGDRLEELRSLGGGLLVLGAL